MVDSFVLSISRDPLSSISIHSPSIDPCGPTDVWGAPAEPQRSPFIHMLTIRSRVTRRCRVRTRKTACVCISQLWVRLGESGLGGEKQRKGDRERSIRLTKLYRGKILSQVLVSNCFCSCVPPAQINSHWSRRRALRMDLFFGTPAAGNFTHSHKSQLGIFKTLAHTT